MSLTASKVGPYFAFGSISFSQLRTNFKETSSGEVKASELLRVTDTTTITDIVNPDNGKKVVQELTEVEFNSVQTPLNESQTLRQQAQQETDEVLKADLEAQADAKFEEARQALFAL